MQQEYNIVNWPIYKIIELLREFFSANEKFKFDDDETNSKIHIREKFAVKLDSPDGRPILSIGRGNIRTHNQWIGNSWSIDGTTGTYTYSDIVDTQVTIDCLSRSGLEAEEIASLVFGMLKFNREYAHTKGFLRIDPPVISEEQIIRATSKIELINVSVVFDVSYAIKWINREKNTYTLNDIIFQTRNTEITTI